MNHEKFYTQQNSSRLFKYLVYVLSIKITDNEYYILLTTLTQKAKYVDYVCLN